MRKPAEVVALTNSQHRNILMRRKKSFNIECVSVMRTGIIRKDEWA